MNSKQQTSKFEEDYNSKNNQYHSLFSNW